MGETSRKLLEKLPIEKCWAITAKTLWRFIVLRGDKLIAPLLGIGKDIVSPLWSKDKWYEINEKIFADGGRMFYPWVKETFNIAVENAIGADKIGHVVACFVWGPEWEYEHIEKTEKRVVTRAFTCPCWEAYEEFEVDPEFRPCDISEELYVRAGLKAIDSKVTFKTTKARPRGDPYCEFIREFREE